VAIGPLRPSRRPANQPKEVLYQLKLQMRHDEANDDERHEGVAVRI